MFLPCCSGGVGRTGTFIALDSLLDMGQAEGKVDIFTFACHLRTERMDMIETYASIVHLVCHYLLTFQFIKVYDGYLIKISTYPEVIITLISHCVFNLILYIKWHLLVCCQSTFHLQYSLIHVCMFSICLSTILYHALFN